MRRGFGALIAIAAMASSTAAAVPIPVPYQLAETGGNGMRGPKKKSQKKARKLKRRVR